MKRKTFFRIFLAGGLISATALAAVTHHFLQDMKSALPQTLYKSERWKGGSRDEEFKGFLKDAATILKLQTKIFLDDEKRVANGNRFARVFHAKSHGCLSGRLTFNSEAERKDPTQAPYYDPQGRTLKGLLKPGGSYRFIARFSNGTGWVHPDKDPDVKGLAIKVIGVEDPVTHKEINVDFLMTNAPNPLGHDQEEFVKFAVASVKGKIATGLFFASRWVMIPKLLAAVGQVDSVANLQFWSGHAYGLGADDAMKFNVLPIGDDSFRQLDPEEREHNPDYLRSDLITKAMSGHIHFGFYVQLEKNEATTPIENTLQEWEESDSPSIRVGDLYFDKQSFSGSFRDEWCEGLRFSPGHYHPDHRPLGNLGRGRIFAYAASQVGRLSQDPTTSVNEVADDIVTEAELDKQSQGLIFEPAP